MISSELCKACISNLQIIVSTLTDLGTKTRPTYDVQVAVNDQLERFTLWMGNIGALHQPESPLSLEFRLGEARDVLTYVLELLDNLKDITRELLTIVSGEREGRSACIVHDSGVEEIQNEEAELCKEIGACITRLFRVSSHVRLAAQTDAFAKALSRNRYRFIDQFDIAHTGGLYNKLDTEEFLWLKEKLGRAITHRRQYLRYIQDHRDKLEPKADDSPEEISGLVGPKLQASSELQALPELLRDSSSLPSTFITKASTVEPDRIKLNMLKVTEESDTEVDTKSHTTISHSIGGNNDSLAAADRVPKLKTLQSSSKKEIECPFCYQIRRFKNERMWRQHVFSDLRAYVCTFPGCDAPYFREVDEWFDHEMQNHRVNYTCPLCESRIFQFKEYFLTHVRSQHSELIIDGHEQFVLDIARKPLDQIPAQECPCCSDWPNHLKENIPAVPIMDQESSDNIVCVLPEVFKRHLASHLERLASFSIMAVPSTDGNSVDSKVAVEGDITARSEISPSSTVAFDDSRPSSPMGWPPPLEDHIAETTINSTTEALIVAASNKTDGRSIIELLLDRRGDDTSITTEVLVAAASNKWYGGPILNLLLGRLGDNTRITTEVLVAAISNRGCGPPTITKLLDRLANDTRITAEVLVAAASNRTNGREITELLLDRRGGDTSITTEVLVAAASNITNGREITELLLVRRGGYIHITEAVLKAAAGNKTSGRGILGLLLSTGQEEIRITEAVLEAAAITSQSGRYILDLLVDRRLDDIADIFKKFRDQGRWEEARILQRRILDKRKASLGDQHPEALESKGNLASTYRNQHSQGPGFQELASSAVMTTTAGQSTTDLKDDDDEYAVVWACCIITAIIEAGVDIGRMSDERNDC